MGVNFGSEKHIGGLMHLPHPILHLLEISKDCRSFVTDSTENASEIFSNYKYCNDYLKLVEDIDFNIF